MVALPGIAAHRDGWKNPRHAEIWQSRLDAYAATLGPMDVGEIAVEHVEAELRPALTTKSDTAARVRGRIEKVLDWAKTKGYRDGENPARWRGNLDHLLPKKSKVAKVRHFPALPWAEMPTFMVRLARVEGMGARAREFAILTAARSGEVRGATWEEIDMDAAEWTVPAERMKAGRPHRVPLSGPALKLLRKRPTMASSPFVFFAARGGKLSDMTVSAVCRRMEVEAVPHGFRSTFRDWCAEATSFPREVVEQALAHVNAEKVEAAYLRTDLFEKRRSLMDDWGRHIASK